ncbi:RHS repeat-associated core domain-containing protein, partial [Candidatus Eisenbacteria bacterium]
WYGGPCDPNPCPIPCNVECPPGAQLEGEPECYTDYVDEYNAGCNEEPYNFQDVFPFSGQPITYCGTGGVFQFGSSFYRDTDWYQITPTSPDIINWTVESSVPLSFYVIDGTSGCSDISLLHSTTTVPCEPHTFANVQLQADGVYWLWVGAPGWDPDVYPCDDTEYVWTLEGYTCEIPFVEDPSDQGPPCDCCEMAPNPSNPIRLFSGEANESFVDLRIPGPVDDLVWGRTYGSRNGPNTVQGNGWDFSANPWIEANGTGVALHDGDSRRDTYYLQADSSFVARQFFRAGRLEADGSFILKFSDTAEWRFYPLDESPEAGKLKEAVDRNGSPKSYEYDGLGRLTRIIDTVGRPIDIAYDTDGFIESVTDFVGRTVSYEYYQDGDAGGSFGDLKSVTTPVVDSTDTFPIPSGHTFPEGKTTVYTYTKGFDDERLNHNLLTITDPKGQTYLTNIYADTEDPEDPDFDRVIAQVWGDPGDSIQFTYLPQEPTPENNYAVVRTIVNDRVGNVTAFFYDELNRMVIHREFDGRADPDRATTDTENHPAIGIKRETRETYETRYEYNNDSKLARKIYPALNEDIYIYESDLYPDGPPRSGGNLREKIRLPGPRGGDQDSLVEYFEYDNGMGGGCCGPNFVTKYINARGDSTLYDYDSTGNRIRAQHFIPSIVDSFVYNSRGQVTTRIHPDNGSGRRQVDQYMYYDSTYTYQEGYLKEEVIDAEHLALTTTHEYDVAGNHIRVIDSRGNDTRYIVNQLNQVVQEISAEVTDASGIRYTTDTYYDANNKVIRVDVINMDDQGILQPNERITVTYDYETLNRVVRKTSEVDPLRTVVTEYEYDANRKRVLTRYGEATGGDQDPETLGPQPANILSVRYDSRGLVYKEIRAEGDSAQSTTQHEYDENKNRVRELRGLEDVPREHLTHYDGYERVKMLTDPMGNLTSHHYDPNGNLISTRIDGQLVDVGGNADSVRLAETSYQYDAMDRKVLEEIEFFDTETQAAILDGKTTTQTEYSDNGQIVRVVDDDGNETRITYDTANRSSVTTDANDNTVTLLYDENSNVIERREIEKSDLGNPDELFVTKLTYDNLNRLIETFDNANQATQYSYDSRGNEVVRIDALGNLVRYEFDGLNRLLSTARVLTDTGLGSGSPVDTIITRRSWDDTSRLIEQTDDNENVTRYGYDPLSRQFLTEYADGTSDSILYDVHDNELSRVDANGTIASSTYDLLDRVTGRTIDAADGVLGIMQEAFEYDGISRIVLSEDDDSRVELKYNSLSRVTSETLTHLDPGARARQGPRKREGQTTTCLYDGVGNQRSCTYPGGREVTCSYDALDRKQAISDQYGSIATYWYIGPGRIEQREYPKPLWQHTTRTSFGYDWVKRITRTTHVRGRGSAAEIIDARTYAWDAMSNKVERADIRAGGPRLKHRYAYDSIYRLRRTVVTDPTPTVLWDEAYDLDGVGNRTEVTGGLNPGPYTMDPTLPEPADLQLNQYTTTSFDGRVYDKNGNLIRVDDGLLTQRDFTYDYRNQMVHFSDRETGTTASYAYDALGRRIRKEVVPGHVIFADDFERPDSPTVGNDWTEEEPPPATVVLQDSTMQLTGQGGGSALHAFAYHALTGAGSEFRALCKIKALNVQSLRGTRMTLWSDRGGPNQATLRIYNTAANAGISASKSGSTSDTTPTVDPLDQFFFMAIEVTGTIATGKIWHESESEPSEPQLQIDLSDAGMAGFVPDEISFIGWNYDPVTSVVDFVTITQVDPDAVATTDYYYDDERIIEEQDGTGATQATYVYGLYIDEVLNMHRGSDNWYYHTDDLYNVMAITDALGVSVERYEYADYGQPLNPTTLAPITGDPSTVGSPFGNGGRCFDPETGLYHYRARYMDPDAGRFQSRDPIGTWGDESNLGNSVAYVASNPWSNLDPHGTLACKGTGAAVMRANSSCGKPSPNELKCISKGAWPVPIKTAIAATREQAKLDAYIDFARSECCPPDCICSNPNPVAVRGVMKWQRGKLELSCTFTPVTVSTGKKKKKKKTKCDVTATATYSGLCMKESTLQIPFTVWKEWKDARP